MVVAVSLDLEKIEMAKGNLSACLPVVLAFEGGYTDDKRDPGNWTGGKVGLGKLKGTKYGVAAASFPNLDIKSLTIRDVEPIYEAKYWREISGDGLPIGIDLATFDFGVNSGVGRAAKYLQAVLGVKADGKIGGQTLRAAIVADKKATIQALCAKRLGFLQGLAIWKTYKGGWSRRVAQVEAKAVAMWLSSLGNGGLSAIDRDELKGEAAKAEDKARVMKSNAGTSAAGGTLIGTWDTVMNGGPNWLVIAGVAVAVLVVVAVLVAKARHNKERADAYAAVAISG